MHLSPLNKLQYLWFFAWSFLCFFPSQILALDPDIIKVRNAIKEAVGASSSNIEVGIFGSHVDGKNFISPLKGGSSDFDMRLVFKNIAPDDPEALRQWRIFREKLRQSLEKQYPDAGELAKILDKTNVYPPEELMKGVTSRAEAFNRFKQLNVSPKLSQQSAAGMTDETFKELAGGLYGETTEKATRQGFEKSVGKVIGKDADGAVKEFLADLTHKAEGEGVYTVKGSGNAASQWIDDALAALEKGNAKGIAKNVQRAKILNKGKDLARVPLKESDIALSNAADEMSAILKEFGEEALEGERLAEFEKRVSAVVSTYGLQDVLKTCRIDAELLKRFGNPRFEGLIVDGLLKGVGKWGKLRGALGQLWSKVPEGSVPAVLNVVILTFEAPDQYEKEGAIKAAFESALGLATLSKAFGPLGWAQLASTITVSILDIVTEYFKDRIYEFAAGSQGCSDLIAGIYTVKGREAQLVNPILEGKCHNVEKIEDLACYTSNEEVVLRLIECHAKNAAKRFEGGEAGEKETAKGILEALMKKCGRDGQNLGSVLRDWLGTRESFKNQWDDFIRNFDGAPLKIWARPDPAEIDNKGPVTVRLEAEIANFSEKTGKAILQCLGGQDTLGFVYPKYKWGVNGILQKETTLPYVDLNFDKPGVYLIDLAVEAEYGSSSPDVKGGYLSKGGQFSLTVNKKEENTSKDDKKDQTATPPVIPIPDSYTKGQIGIGKESGKKTGADIQPGPIGPTDSSKTDEKTIPTGKTDSGKTDTTKTDTGTKDTGKSDATKTDTAKTDTTTTGKTGTTTSAKTPPCTYKYSEWGECNRATKKWTRTVIAMEPQGCIETGKPVLEDGCNPPPTEEEKRNNYLNCLCRCYGGWAGHIGVWYDPEGKSKPECESSGPCFGGAGAFGCSRRHYFGAPNDCAKSCYEGTYGKGTYDENKADKIRKDENNKLKKPLKLKVNEGKCPIKAQLGDIINLTAAVEGGIPPHKFSWTGNGQAKDNTFTFANTREPGSHPISATVTDDEGNSATTACQVIVDAVTVKIELLDKERKIPIGESRNFKGTVMSGNKPAGGDFYFLWQPHPEIQFSPFEKTGGSVSGTRATFNKLGNFKVWVIAHTYKGNVKTTLGESEQIEIEVSKPELTLSYQPPNPKVGQEVKLTVTDKPKMDDKAISFWWEISGNALNAGPLKNEREYTFRPKDGKPVTVTVHGKAKQGGNDLGEDKATITAQEYKVSLSEPQHLGSKPKIWKCDTQLGGAQNCGLVEVTKELAVFNDIFIKAAVAPEPEKPPLRYAWSIKPEGLCGIPGAGQELKMNCSQTGSYTTSVTVRDSQDVVLGTASTNVGITISKDDLEKGKKHLVTLQADKTALKTGETANIKAMVQGGKPPYTYKWNGGVEGQGESAKFTPKKSGTHKIAVEVADNAGQKTPATLDIKVETAKLEAALKADKTTVKIGETANIKAEVKGGEPAYSYKWSDGIEGKGDSVRFTPKKTGSQKITLEVTDSAKQKNAASLDLMVEASKLEVTLTADKTPLKTGETAKIRAAVKGGKEPYTYSWSSQVAGNGESVDFSSKTTGFFKIYVEVRDGDKKKVLGNLDITVQEGKIDSKTSDTKGTDTKTAPTKSGETKTTDSKDSGLKEGSVAARQVIEPETMKLAPGESGIFRALEIDKSGKKTEIPPSKVSWKIDLYRGAYIDKTGKVSVEKTAKPGTAIKVTALLGNAPAGASLEITSISAGTSIIKESGIKETVKGTKVIQPDLLQIAPGGSGLISLLEKDGQGRTSPPADTRKLSWKLEPSRKDLTLKPQNDGVVVITAKSGIKVGTQVKVVATLDQFQVSGMIEIVPAQTPDKGKGTEKDKEQKLGSSPVAESDPSKTDRFSSHKVYDPLSDPGFKNGKTPLDTDKMNKLKTDFQDAQWATQDKKTKQSSDPSQQNVQQQPTDYTKSSGQATQTQSPNQPPTDPTKTPVDTSKAATDPSKNTTDLAKTTTDTTKTKTDTAKPTDQTQPATTKGIDVKVVGEAPSGKCLIVEGQLVPVKGYKENIANMTVTLTGPVNKSVTSSAKGTFKFPEIPAGNYILSVKQWNYGMTKQNFAAPSGKSVKIVLKGSCPFLYVWTGEKYEKENDIYSVARLMPQELLSSEARHLADREGFFLSPISLNNIPEKLKKEKALKDYYRITRPLAADQEGNYRLKILEQAGEHSFTDRVQLMAVDHHTGTCIGITRGGRPFLYKNLNPNLPFQKPAELYNNEFIEMALPRGSFKDKVLRITWQGFQEGTPQGHSAATGRPRLALQRKTPKGTWQTVDWIYPRDEVQESLFILENLGRAWDRGGKIRLAAISCHPEKYHRIDSVGMARLLSKPPQVTYLKLLSAVKSTGATILASLLKRDDQYLSLGPEESADLIFQGTPRKTDSARSFIFISEGFYIPMPSIRLTLN